MLAALPLLALSLTVGTPAAATGPATRSGPASSATVVLAGQVRNGNPVKSDDTTVIVPQGLPAVTHATVTIPQLSRSTTTNAQGNFSFRLPASYAGQAVSVKVTARGFGSWQESGITLAGTGSTSIYVQLNRASHSYAVPRSRPRQPFNGPETRRPRGNATTAAIPAASDAYTSCGHNSSGWTSQEETPPSIRVYMTGSGDIADYDFTFYEEHVLPNEWGSGAPYAALQAGAEAVRDYAWYFVLNGSKGTAANVDPCSFDVDDSTAYQYFNPSLPTYSNTNNAVTSTATTVFSHGGTITETSYCSNFGTGCGADTPPDTCGEYANGTSMSQIGSDSCADDGDTWQQILSTYYYPGYTLHDQLAAYAFWEGTNGHLYEAQGPANGSLSGPTDRGMQTLGSAPAAGVDINGYTYVYWEGGGPSYDLWEAYWNGSAWVGPYDRGMGTLGSQPTVAIYP
jgi:Carboxypeptidase regulatory-like domain/Stage II sporulation protein